MLGIHVLGHVGVTWLGKPVALSAKAVALLTYLALEQQPYHREYLAELLWDHASAPSNLRVELVRLKKQGLDLFEPRQVMLAVDAETDLLQLQRALPELTLDTLPGWLSRVRGVPLSGLEDLGSAQFREWTDMRRSQLTDAAEQLLLGAAQRFRQVPGGEPGVARIRERAAFLGLDLPEWSAPPLPSETPLLAEILTLRRLLPAAPQGPQLVLLPGQSATQQRFLDEVISGTAWNALHLRSAPNRLLRAALLHHLAALHGTPAPAPAPDDEGELLQLAHLLVTLPRPLLLTVHDIKGHETWLAGALRFLLELRAPLLLTITASTPRPLRALRQQLGRVDPGRLHVLHLPPLGTLEMLRLFPELSCPPASPDEAYTAAATLAQRSEGCCFAAQAMQQAQSHPARPWTADSGRQPEQVTEALLAELYDLPRATYRHLQTLAMLTAPFDLSLAEQVLGDEAASTLRQACERGLIAPSPETEDVVMPALEYRLNDAVPHFAFVSEAQRVALVAGLGSAERHDLRGRLARLYLGPQPALARLYAERGGLSELAARAQAASPAPLTAQWQLPAARPAAAPAQATETGRRESQTTNGYRVALSSAGLEVLRHGPPGPARGLRLRFPAGPGGVWHLRLRLDVYAAQWDLQPEVPHALGLTCGGQSQGLWRPEPGFLHPLAPPEVGLGELPRGRWVELEGQGPPGPLVLTVRAQQLALTISDLTWNSVSLLPGPETANHSL